jgi:hypothetical protein
MVRFPSSAAPQGWSSCDPCAQSSSEAEAEVAGVEAGIPLADTELATGKRPLRQAVDEFLAEKKRTKAH